MNLINVLRSPFRTRRELEQRVKRLQAVIEALSNPKTFHLDYDEESHKALFELKADFVPLFIGWMAEWFREQGGMNYVEVEAFHPETGPLLFTMQRKDGTTPHELRCEAEAQSARLQQEIDQMCHELDELDGIAEVEGWDEEG